MATKEKPGPKPDHLQIEGDWEEAAKKAIQKEKPNQGWPKGQAENTMKHQIEPMARVGDRTTYWCMKCDKEWGAYDEIDRDEPCPGPHDEKKSE